MRIAFQIDFLTTVDERQCNFQMIGSSHDREQVAIKV